MDRTVDINVLESLRNGDHKAFETIFIACYNKTKIFIDGYIKSESDAEELILCPHENTWSVEPKHIICLPQTHGLFGHNR